MPAFHANGLFANPGYSWIPTELCREGATLPGKPQLDESRTPTPSVKGSDLHCPQRVTMLAQQYRPTHLKGISQKKTIKLNWFI